MGSLSPQVGAGIPASVDASAPSILIPTSIGAGGSPASISIGAGIRTAGGKASADWGAAYAGDVCHAGRAAGTSPKAIPGGRPGGSCFATAASSGGLGCTGPNGPNGLWPAGGQGQGQGFGQGQGQRQGRPA